MRRQYDCKLQKLYFTTIIIIVNMLQPSRKIRFVHRNHSECACCCFRQTFWQSRGTHFWVTHHKIIKRVAPLSVRSFTKRDSQRKNPNTCNQFI